MEILLSDFLVECGVARSKIFRGKETDIPGFFRPEKNWDILIVEGNALVLAIELKSQTGTEIGKNYYNRSEEALGNSICLINAHQERLFVGNGAFRPFMGYLFLLEDNPESQEPVGSTESHFKVDPVFSKSSYSKRYQILLTRLVQTKHYDAAVLLTSEKDSSSYNCPNETVDWFLFLTSIAEHVSKWKVYRNAQPGGEFRQALFEDEGGYTP